LALLAVVEQDASTAREQYAALETQRGTLLTGFIFNDRLLGLLAQTMGDLDLAVSHYHDALAF
jgi:hypothetical protein